MTRTERPPPLPGERAPTRAQLDQAVRALELLADETRLTLLYVLTQGEYDVNSLAVLVGNSLTSTSQHLAKLRAGGLVATRRDGKRVIYRAKGRHVRRLVTETIAQAQRLAPSSTEPS
jgi:DNA-binding transcriptional ArsR family regulator